MKIKQYHIYTTLIILFGIDILYLYGYNNLVDVIIDNAITWLLLTSAGFALSYLFNKAEVKYKAIMNILITLGLLFNLSLIVSWYTLRGFGF